MKESTERHINPRFFECMHEDIVYDFVSLTSIHASNIVGIHKKITATLDNTRECHLLKTFSPHCDLSLNYSTLNI